MEVLSINDNVMWRGGFGNDAPQMAKVVSIERVEEGEKDGVEVDSIEWDDIGERNVVVTLESGNWAYGYQISQIK